MLVADLPQRWINDIVKVPLVRSLAMPTILQRLDRENGGAHERAIDNKGAVQPRISVLGGFHGGFDAKDSWLNEIRFSFGPPPPLRFHTPIFAKACEPKTPGRGLRGIVGRRNALILRQKIVPILTKSFSEWTGEFIAGQM